MRQINQMEWSIDSEVDVNITLRELFLADIALNLLEQEKAESYILKFYPKLYDKIFNPPDQFAYDTSRLINNIETILGRYNIGG